MYLNINTLKSILNTFSFSGYITIQVKETKDISKSSRHLVYWHCLSCLVTFSNEIIVQSPAARLNECNGPFNHSSTHFSQDHGNVDRTHSQAIHSFMMIT